MSNDIALVEYSMESTRFIWATAVGNRLGLLHTCFMPENGEEIQEKSGVVGMLVVVGNTLLEKYPTFANND